MLIINIWLENCKQCHHIDHSGSFTPGGAKLICGHNGASRCINIIKDINDGWFWENRIVDGVNIPDWCPLQNGYNY